jgi:Cu-Zn family superoxide dismutase
LNVLLTSCGILKIQKSHNLNNSEELIVHIRDIATNKEIGKDMGILFTPHLYNLPGPSSHGFHVHINPSCDDNGMAAVGH